MDPSSCLSSFASSRTSLPMNSSGELELLLHNSKGNSYDYNNNNNDNNNDKQKKKIDYDNENNYNSGCRNKGNDNNDNDNNNRNNNNNNNNGYNSNENNDDNYDNDNYGNNDRYKNNNYNHRKDKNDETDLDSVGDRLVVSFRGSVLGNVLTDLKITQVSIPSLKHRKKFFIKMILGFEKEKEKEKEMRMKRKQNRDFENEVQNGKQKRNEREIEKEKKNEKDLIENQDSDEKSEKRKCNTEIFFDENTNKKDSINISSLQVIRTEIGQKIFESDRGNSQNALTIDLIRKEESNTKCQHPPRPWMESLDLDSTTIKIQDQNSCTNLSASAEFLPPNAKIVSPPYDTEEHSLIKQLPDTEDFSSRTVTGEI